MSRVGMLAAKHHATKLPAFGSQAEAQTALFAQRDEILSSFIAEHPQLDFSPDSLLVLEKQYIEGGRPTHGKSKYSFAVAIGFYFGEVLCRNAGFHWVVDEYVFHPGLYEIGVRKNRLSLMLTGGKAPREERNERMKSLWSDYRRYAP